MQKNRSNINEMSPPVFSASVHQKSFTTSRHQVRKTSSSPSSSSAADKNGCCNASAAEARFWGLSSMHKSRNSNAIFCSRSNGGMLGIAHSTILKNVIGFSLSVGSVVSKEQSTISIVIDGTYCVIPRRPSC